MLIRKRVAEFGNRVFRSAGSIWTADHVVPRHKNVHAILTRNGEKLLFLAENIVTNAGDTHYAKRMANEAVTNSFGTHELASAGTPGKTANRSNFTVIGSTQKANSAGYPQTDDGDADNTGAGIDIVSHLGSWTKADFNATGITHGLITNSAPGASEAILTGYAFAASFDKTSNDTLKVFVNHEALGV